jgi:Homing endonuclease associated repeat
MSISKEEILAALTECADKLGRCPSLADMKAHGNIGVRAIRRYFRTYTDALREAGLDPFGPGHRVKLEALLVEWMEIARRLAKVPSVNEYRAHSRHSVQPLISRFGAWSEVPRGLVHFAQENGLEAPWQDVIGMIREHEGPNSQAGSYPHRLLRGKPVYGSPLHAGPLAHAPTNEMGVIYLFGALAGELGFIVTRIQTEFPDCEAMRKSGHDQWQRLRLEFEFESRNFLAHQHDPQGCDLVVCWTHNWPECPEHLEVLELSAIVRSTGEEHHHAG